MLVAAKINLRLFLRPASAPEVDRDGFVAAPPTSEIRRACVIGKRPRERASADEYTRPCDPPRSLHPCVALVP
jgi:hypothetical protein